MENEHVLTEKDESPDVSGTYADAHASVRSETPVTAENPEAKDAKAEAESSAPAEAESSAPAEAESSAPAEAESSAPAEAFKEEFIKDLSSFVEGEIVEGTVVAVANDSVFVDIGYKSEGEISKDEFTKDPAPGAKFSVMIIRRENKEGRPVLSKQKADDIVKWERINKAYREKTPIEGKIAETVKGGFYVDIDGIMAFLPVSQASDRKVTNKEDLIGKKLPFLVERVEGKKNVVLTHRKYITEVKEKQLKEFFNNRSEGEVIEGVVKDIVSYGAFVDIGGIDGLLHNNDLSWGRVNDPKKYLEKGQAISCKILMMDPKNHKVALGIKQLSEDPWLSFEGSYEKQGRYKGTVTKLTNFGAFVELEEGIEGLLHVSDLSWTKRVKHPKEILKAGDVVETMILDYNLDKKTVSLGLKQVLPNPWDEVEVRYPVGSKIKTKVMQIAKFGIFLEIEEGIVGLLHSNDMTWTKPAKEATINYKVGAEVDVVVLSIDKENRKIQLGTKQLKKNPWADLRSRYPKGSVITGTVTSLTDFGVFVKVDEDIEGLIHLSQLSNDRVSDPGSIYKPGDKVKATILTIDEDKHKVALSVKQYLNHLDKKEMNKYLEDGDTDTASVTLGDLIDLSKIGK
jgi:small subunit ribosomal protein S1